MKDLQVVCDSVNDKVEFKYDNELLSTLTWGDHESQVGFYVENAKKLMRVYDGDFYVLDEEAAMCFIKNCASKIKMDQGLDNISYILTDGTECKIPVFLPYTIDDNEIAELSSDQVAICKIWDNFVSKKVFNYNLSMDLVELLGPQLSQAFFDVLNAEMYFLRQFGEVRSEEN